MSSSSQQEPAAAASAVKTRPPKPVYESQEEASRFCNQWVDSGLTSNKGVQFLLRHLIDLGCTPPDRFIQCIQCDRPGAGFFGMVQEERLQKSTTGKTSSNISSMNNDAEDSCSSSSDLRGMLQRERDGLSKLQIKPEIYLCQQYMANEIMVHRTMIHELIHAIDQCRTKMDPLRNCVHIACTEIRAENLSGECSFWKELPRMDKFAGHGKACVRRRAILSVRGNPNCTKDAEKYVDAAMHRCFQDVYPFPKHPNQL